MSRADRLVEEFLPAQQPSAILTDSHGQLVDVVFSCAVFVQDEDTAGALHPVVLDFPLEVARLCITAFELRYRDLVANIDDVMAVRAFATQEQD